MNLRISQIDVPPAPGSRSGRDRGAVLVEAALMAPLVIFLLLGVLETGWLLKTHLSVEQTTSYGARTGAIAGAEDDADVAIMDEIERRLVHGRSDIERVVVYRAVTVDAAPPSACVTGSAPGSIVDGCTIYGPDDFETDAASLACAWCPADRAADQLLGVWISYEYESITGIFGGLTLTNGTVLRIEHPVGF